MSERASAWSWDACLAASASRIAYTAAARASESACVTACVSACLRLAIRRVILACLRRTHSFGSSGQSANHISEGHDRRRISTEAHALSIAAPRKGLPIPAPSASAAPSVSAAPARAQQAADLRSAAVATFSLKRRRSMPPCLWKSTAYSLCKAVSCSRSTMPPMPCCSAPRRGAAVAQGTPREGYALRRRCASRTWRPMGSTYHLV